MGLTIGSKRYSADMGGHGFNRFRCLLARRSSFEFGKHYAQLDDIYLTQTKNFYTKHDIKTAELIENGFASPEVANFLYQSDIEGKININQVRMIYKIIKDCDDNISFGYIGRPDCATMKDMKLIFNDKTKVEWY